MKKRKILVPLFISLLIAFATMEFRMAANATVRSDIEEPIYTIERKGCSKALSTGKHVLKLGPMFWGLYPAGMAFKTPEDAREYMKNKDMNAEEWGVYRLSGDYELDVDKQSNPHYINKSLMIIEKVT